MNCDWVTRDVEEENVEAGRIDIEDFDKGIKIPFPQCECSTKCSARGEGKILVEFVSRVE